MSKPYRPSNGSEGEGFMEAFCFRCARDGEDSPCFILGRALGHNIGDPDYPPEWVQDEQGSRCTAFTLEASPDEVDRFYARRDPRQASLPL